MSEFSESYHLRSDRTEVAIELLHRARRKGFVFPAANGWVTFVAEEGTFEPDPQIIAAATQPILHFVFAEDHGWSFALYDRTTITCAYRCDWEDDIHADDSRYSRSALLDAVPLAPTPLLDDLERWMNDLDSEDVFEREPAKLFAQSMGLVHYDWLSYDDLSRDYAANPAAYAHVTRVR